MEQSTVQQALALTPGHVTGKDKSSKRTTSSVSISAPVVSKTRTTSVMALSGTIGQRLKFNVCA